jgi:hypothetical protein
MIRRLSSVRRAGAKESSAVNDQRTVDVPAGAIARLIAMVKSGLLNLQGYQVLEFPLSSIAQAIAHAAETSGPFSKTALPV